MNDQRLKQELCENRNDLIEVITDPDPEVNGGHALRNIAAKNYRLYELPPTLEPADVEQEMLLRISRRFRIGNVVEMTERLELCRALIAEENRRNSYLKLVGKSAAADFVCAAEQATGSLAEELADLQLLAASDLELRDLFSHVWPQLNFFERTLLRRLTDRRCRKEIAEDLGISVSTLGRWSQRGIDGLDEKLTRVAVQAYGDDCWLQVLEDLLLAFEQVNVSV